MSRPFDGNLFDDAAYDVDQVIVIRPQWGGGALGVGRAVAFQAAGVDVRTGGLRCETGRFRVRGGTAQLSVGRSMRGAGGAVSVGRASAVLCRGRALHVQAGRLAIAPSAARLSRCMPDEEEAILQVLLAA